jgi:NADPH:quinone reductase-like Zn-dependent oxidoreductase
MKTVCPHQYNKACSPKEGGKFTTIWRFSIRPDLANNLSDSGTIADEIQRKFPGGVDNVLEMNATVTLEDSFHCAKQGGIVCMTGIVGNQWSFDRFAPMDAIPTGAYLTV